MVAGWHAWIYEHETGERRTSTMVQTLGLLPAGVPSPSSSEGRHIQSIDRAGGVCLWRGVINALLLGLVQSLLYVASHRASSRRLQRLAHEHSTAEQQQHREESTVSISCLRIFDSSPKSFPTRSIDKGGWAPWYASISSGPQADRWRPKRASLDL